MPLREGEVAPDGDVWFRLITSKSHISRGKIKHGAFKGKFLGRANSDRPYTTEISGRLRSEAGSIDEIRAHAEAYCKAKASSGQKFAGLMFCQKAAAAKVFDQFSMNVYFTPITSGPDVDPAHSDIGIAGPPIVDGSPEYDRLVIELSDLLRGLHSPDQIDLLPEAIADGPPSTEMSQTELEPGAVASDSLPTKILRFLGIR